jgi:CheY-like chemotaxis protein
MQSFKRRILCVDNQEDSCDIVNILLARAGYEVIVVHTAAEALNKALTGGFDLLLLDNHLPGSSGVELCQQIRKVNNHTPICFYSRKAVPRQIEAAMRAGANAYLVKPVISDDVEQMVEQLLQ